MDDQEEMMSLIYHPQPEGGGPLAAIASGFAAGVVATIGILKLLDVFKRD